MNKLAPVKRKGPKELADEREYNWHRATVILYGFQGLEPNPDHTDLWWCRKFLRGIILNPIVKTGKNEANEYDQAIRYLATMDKKWPEPNYNRRKRKKPGNKTTVKKPAKAQNESLMALCRKTLRRVRKDIKALQPKMDWWERKLIRTSIADKKWTEIRETTIELRKRMAALELQAGRLKAKLENK